MKVFLDTNVFIEYFQCRQQYKSVSKILNAIEDKQISAVVSAGCVYTLTYIIRMELKKQGIYRPEQTERLRTMMNLVLSMATVGTITHKHIVAGINDLAFDDMEDSFQYQCALQNKCDVLITINLHDFRNATPSGMQILSPDEFVRKYTL